MLKTTTSRHAVPALAVACLLGGCSGAQPEAADSPRVASLTSAAPAESPSGSIDDQRPLATTNDEAERLFKDWEACVRKEGGPAYDETPKIVIVKWKQKDPDGVRVWEACYTTFPESFSERQLRLDPVAHRENQREFYECAKAAGYELTKPDEDGLFGLSEIGPNGDAGSPKFQECERQAFAD